MIIRTGNGHFTVVEVLRKTSYGQTSVCRDMESGRLYVLNCFSVAQGGSQCLPLLMEAKANPAFSDFVQVFTQEGAVWSQFVHSPSVSLKRYLHQRPIGLLERLAIARNLLQALVMQNMPTQMAAAVTNSHHILVDETTNVSFRYVLDTQDMAEPENMAQIGENLKRVFQLLFAQELEAKSAPEMEGFLQPLGQGDFGDYLAMYAAFLPIAEAVGQRAMEGSVAPQTFLFRLWNRMKKLFKLAKPFLIGLVIIASFCYLVYTLLSPKAFSGTPILYDAIGTVEILPQNGIDGS